MQIRVFPFFAMLSTAWAILLYFEIVSMNEELEAAKAGGEMMEAQTRLNMDQRLFKVYRDMIIHILNVVVGL